MIRHAAPPPRGHAPLAIPLPPVPYDRNLPLRFGAAAVHAVERGNFGCMVGLQGNRVRSVPLGDAVSDIERVPTDGEVVRTARRMGVSFGD